MRFRGGGTFTSGLMGKQSREHSPILAFGVVAGGVGFAVAVRSFLGQAGRSGNPLPKNGAVAVL